MYAAIEEIERVLPNKFNYYMFKDPYEVAGRLEFTVFKGATELVGSMSGTLVHSKAQTGDYIKDNEQVFLAHVSRAIE